MKPYNDPTNGKNFIIKPFYKDENTINDLNELRDYVSHLKSEMYNLIDLYNDLANKLIPKE